MHPSRIYGHTDDLGYDVIHHSRARIWFARCFIALISRYRYHVHRVRVPGRGFSAQSGTADQVISLLFPP